MKSTSDSSPLLPQQGGEQTSEFDNAACPFCGSTDISEGEVLSETPNGRVTTQSMCRGCGALGPEAKLDVDEVDYGSVKSTAAWNRRAAVLPQVAEAKPAALAKLKKAVQPFEVMAKQYSEHPHSDRWAIGWDGGEVSVGQLLKLVSAVQSIAAPASVGEATAPKDFEPSFPNGYLTSKQYHELWKEPTADNTLLSTGERFSWHIGMFADRVANAVIASLGEAKAVAPQELSRMNDLLCDFALRWKLNGDWLTCKKCKHNHIASKADQSFYHNMDCKGIGAFETHPWSTLVSILSPLYAAPVAVLGEAKPDREEALERELKQWSFDNGDQKQLASDFFYAAWDAATASVAPAGLGQAKAVAAELYVECRECDSCGHVGMNDDADNRAACNTCGWTGAAPTEDKCPECQRIGTMSAACPKCSECYRLIGSKTLAAPVSQALPVDTSVGYFLPTGYAVKHAEGHGWIVTAPGGSKWIAFEDTPAGDLFAAMQGEKA